MAGLFLTQDQASPVSACYSKSSTSTSSFFIVASNQIVKHLPPAGGDLAKSSAEAGLESRFDSARPFGAARSKLTPQTAGSRTSGLNQTQPPPDRNHSTAGNSRVMNLAWNWKLGGGTPGRSRTYYCCIPILTCRSLLRNSRLHFLRPGAGERLSGGTGSAQTRKSAPSSN